MANALGLERADYRGVQSTLCPGCGHDSISNQIISVAYDMGLPMHRVIKLSGIGCSSKTPAYFLGRSHAFNAVHGRMPSVATGATLANSDLIAMAVSGDGDTGSIGLGQYKHLIRRNVPMVYIIENNGVYGLTKGQFSATADEGQKLKYYGLNELPAIDLCLEAVVGGCTFVARSFSGDSKQVQALLKAALSHRGTAVLDIISPCVTFNNAPDSNKSYSYGKENEIPLHEIDFMPKGYVAPREEITADYAEGQMIEVEMHDGSIVRLKKLDKGHDPRNRLEAIQVLEQAQREQLFLTGLLYYEEPRPVLIDTLHVVETPLASLPQEKLRPSREALDELMKSYM
ncbi:2-oxoacid:ferredoxin oxidoreductase subunit beta [Anaerolineae bacterium CFX9]|jgi:2-oxoglutarate ferredoxin oxidoreductase subunit beta|nr:2-oxoacid:ferredoxin oxidoreductase subunit beta [Kamptonema cortianum]MDL1899716.1 2-oxoacid:ferredoxin oxidoreductase subunit beta [Anaerolineae bacterium CFX9]